MNSLRRCRGGMRVLGQGILYLSLFLISCTPTLKEGDSWNSVRQVKEINYLRSNVPGCDEAFTRALNHYASHGIKFITNKEAAHTFTCLPCAPLWLRVLSPVYEQGLQQGNIAYARMCGGVDHRTKLVVHEIAHLYTNNGHSHTWKNFIKGKSL